MNNFFKNKKILIIDPSVEIINSITEIINNEIETDNATSSENALEKIHTRSLPDLIISDVTMKGMSGFKLLEILKANEQTKDIPFIFMKWVNEFIDETRGLELGAVDFIIKPIRPNIVMKIIQNQLELKTYRDSLEELVQERTKEISQMQEATIQILAALAESRNPGSLGHIVRVQKFIKLLALRLKNHSRFSHFLNDYNIDLLYKTSPLHDIGKVGIPDNILLKAGKLNHIEYECIKKHPIFGHDALLHAEKQVGHNSFLSMAREMAHFHQERWDGSGYPQGLKGDEIPISARLLAIVDVYDSLISKRVYKSPKSHFEAVQLIMDQRGKHFDPDIADAFFGLKDKFKEIAIKYADYDEEKEILKKIQ